MSYDYVIGDFMWTGIDYYGESRWPSRGSSSGYLDNCGFKKDGYWFFKSIWSDEPVLHLFPHWNWEGREGDIIQVACFTNCEEVELFVNGKSYGRKVTEFPRKGVELGWNRYGAGKRYATTSDLHLVWDVEYQPGEIKAVGIRNGERFEEIIRTAGAPVQLRASVDRPSFKAEPGDVAHVTVEVLDSVRREMEFISQKISRSCSALFSSKLATSCGSSPRLSLTAYTASISFHGAISPS